MSSGPMVNLQDGYLNGVFLHERNLFIWCTEPSFEKVTLKLVNVSLLSLESFLEGNIIFEHKFEAPTAKDAPLLARLHQASEKEAKTQVKAWIDDAKQDKKKLFSLKPSYGASICCLAESLEVSFDWTHFTP